MLSKVLDPAALEIRTMTWGTRLSAAGQKPSNGANGQNHTAQLEARIAELSGAAAVQSREAYDDGFRAGEVSGRRSAESRVSEAVREWAASVAAVGAVREDVMRRAEADVVGLAIEIARRVLHREVTVDRNALRALIAAAIDKLQAQEIYRVRIHPAQEALVRACLSEMGRGSEVEVVKDPVQPEGGAVFETARGYLDASVDTQLDEIERGLVDKLRDRA